MEIKNITRLFEPLHRELAFGLNTLQSFLACHHACTNHITKESIGISNANGFLEKNIWLNSQKVG